MHFEPCPDVVHLLRAGFSQARNYWSRLLRSKRTLSLLTALLVMQCAATSAHAVTCGAYTSSGNVVNAGRLSIAASASPGTTAATISPSPVAFASSPCTGSAAEGFTTYIHTAAPLVRGYNDVYETNISGLGVRYRISARCTSVMVWSTLVNNAVQQACALSGGKNIGGWDVRAILVVTGPIAAGVSTLTTVPALTVGWSPVDGAEQGMVNFLSGSATGTIVAPSCTVNASSVAVSMPTAMVSGFAAGVGATSGGQAFSLSFSCAPGAKVYMTLTDSVNVANRTNTLTLSSDSSARGVGIQVLDATGAPVTFGADSDAAANPGQWLIGTSPSGTLQVPLTARYIRTGAVVPGSVKGLATFTMSYQ